MTEPQTAELVSTSQLHPGVVLMTMDMPGSAANILSDEMFKALDRSITPLMQDKSIAGLVLYSAKPKIFVAGANLKKIVASLDWPDQEIIEFCQAGRAVMRKFSECPFPTVAAIHGACVGGGLELPLWCDGRVASDDRRTVLGLPEVKLGLIPGWAGTVRLPRMCGVETGIDLVTSGRLVGASDGKQLGFVDSVCSQEALVETAVGLIGELNEDRRYESRRQKMLGPVSPEKGDTVVVEEWVKRIEDNRSTWYFAPKLVLEHMARTAHYDHAAACDSESQVFATVWGSPPSRGLLNHFFLGEHNKKRPGFVDLSIEPQPVESVAIIGAGTMGRLIADNNLSRRKSVKLFDANRQLSSDVADELAENNRPIQSIDTIADVSGCQLVIETVVENREVKRQVLAEIESAADGNTIIATNTSAIELAKLADCLERPEQFCGIHFCHPELMSLVEIIRGGLTSEPTIATAVSYVRSLGKMPLVVKDRAGFVVNRLLAASLAQAFRLAEAGIEFQAIDRAMREFGFLGGPFEVMDTIGIDTCLLAGKQMWDGGIEAVSSTPILPRMVKLERLGRKTLKGFYQYSSIKSLPQLDPAAVEVVNKYSRPAPEFVETFQSEIPTYICAGIVREASNLLDDAVVADPRDIDIAIINGFSFPAHQGGILFWADQVGVSAVVEVLETAARFDEALAPTNRLREMAEQKSTFF